MSIFSRNHEVSSRQPKLETLSLLRTVTLSIHRLGFTTQSSEFPSHQTSDSAQQYRYRYKKYGHKQTGRHICRLSCSRISGMQNTDTFATSTVIQEFGNDRDTLCA